MKVFGDAGVREELAVVERGATEACANRDGALRRGEYHKLAEFGLGPELAASPSPDFVAIAAGYGVPARPVDSIAALEDAVPKRGPMLIDARISREVRSPLYLRGRPG